MPQNFICYELAFFGKDPSDFLHQYISVLGVFNVSPHHEFENVYSGVEVSFESGLLNFLLLQLFYNYSLLSSKCFEIVSMCN